MTSPDKLSLAKNARKTTCRSRSLILQSGKARSGDVLFYIFLSVFLGGALFQHFRVRNRLPRNEISILKHDGDICESLVNLRRESASETSCMSDALVFFSGKDLYRTTPHALLHCFTCAVLHASSSSTLYQHIYHSANKHYTPVPKAARGSFRLNCRENIRDWERHEICNQSTCLRDVDVAWHGRRAEITLVPVSDLHATDLVDEARGNRNFRCLLDFSREYTSICCSAKVTAIEYNNNETLRDRMHFADLFHTRIDVVWYHSFLLV